MTGDPFEVDRLFAVVSDESHILQLLSDAVARLQEVQDAKRRLATLDGPTLRAAIAVRHARLGQR